MALSSSPLTHARVVGRYALHDEIASGGMATVHIGRLMGPVGFSRVVAIKRLHPQYAKEPDFVSMFLDEARLAARIRHPNVVGTLDVVALEGELFLVMEYVQGESLALLMRTMHERAAGVPIPIAVAIIVDVLEGLHAAHEAVSDHGEPLGIVHRDVSPQNVLVGTDGVARVVDFGVAKAAGRVQSTRDGQLKGKLGYMAPEQIGGITTRATDVRAASVVLWEMLTGRRLYHAENDLQTFSSILAGTGLVAPSRFAPNVSPALNRVVLQGLQFKPDDRFPSAREMARALQKVAPLASPSDVGDWVEAMAGPSIGARARKIAAIESSSVLPPAPSSPESLDPARLSHPPVSGERVRSVRVPGERLWLVPAAVMAALSVGTSIGIFLRMSGTHAAPRIEHTSAAASPPAARPPTGWVALAPAASSTVGRPAALAASPASAKSSEARGLLPSPPLHPTPAPPVSPQSPLQAQRATAATWPQGTTPQAAAAGSSNHPPASPGSDFAHVMDSRK